MEAIPPGQFTPLITLLEHHFGNEKLHFSDITNGNMRVVFSTEVPVISMNFLSKLDDRDYEVTSFGSNMRRLSNLVVTFQQKGENAGN